MKSGRDGKEGREGKDGKEGKDQTRPHGRISRRDAVKVGLALSAGYGVAAPAWAKVRERIAQGTWQAQFFSAAELATFRVLADLVIPRDERSGGATEAGVVEYADFVLNESGDRTKQQWRDGFRWLDGECARRFTGRRFVECAEAERAQVLDAIAVPQRASQELRTAAEWFTRVRDLVGSGFFSSQMGVADIQYTGGVFNPTWQGAPPEALRELGVSYEAWDRRYGGRR